MNFQTVRQADGENVTMNAFADRIDGITFIPSGTAKQNCKFTDANGEQQSVTIWQGKGQPLPEDKRGQTLSINISCKVKGNRTNYGGFWNSTAQTRPLNQQVANAPLQGQQGLNCPQPTTKPSYQPNAKKEVDWDAIAEGKVRHGVLCAMLQGGLEVDYQAILEYTQFIVTGKIYADQQAGHDNRSVSEQADGIPF